MVPPFCPNMLRLSLTSVVQLRDSVHRTYFGSSSRKVLAKLKPRIESGELPTLEQGVDFFRWIVDFVHATLNPCSSYDR